MKTAVYIEDGTVQLVLTPDSEFEEGALKAFRDKPLDAKLFKGSFYDCRGGWVRQDAYHGNRDPYISDGLYQDKSLIIRIDDEINQVDDKVNQE